MNEIREHWRGVRGYLDAHRHPLAAGAARLYPSSLRVAGTTFLAAPGWIRDEPVDAAEIVPRWRPEAAAAAVTGGEPEARQPMGRYSQTLAALAPPRLLDNRRVYRLVDVDADRPPDPRALTFGPGRYFDSIDVCEAVGHEFADRVLSTGNTKELPWREFVGDPFDTARRPGAIAICTLVLRHDPAGGAPPRMLLHRRDAQGVASGGGLIQVAPAGIFQPSDDSRPDDADELDPWKATARELAEELLGRHETYGVPGEPFDYDTWPFYQELARARAAGSLRVSWLGVGVDPLTLVMDALQVAVFDAEVYDRLLSRLVTTTVEGDLVGAGTAGVPFTAKTVEAVTTSEPVQPAGAALLRLAFQHRHTLL